MLAKTVILIPSHGLEDFPTELGNDDAAGLLNAFAAAFHPLALAATEQLPTWQRADVPPEDPAGNLLLVPGCCESWLPHGWAASAAEAGAIVLTAGTDRGELVSHLESALAEGRDERLEVRVERGEGETSHLSSLTSDLFKDFLAFGSAYLQIELLTRRMHYYSSLDESPLRGEIVAAAKAALSADTAADPEQARRHLDHAAEQLLDSRERFFPVDCFLIDFCLVIPRLAGALAQAGTPETPVSYLASAGDWEEIHHAEPDLVARLRQDWKSGRIDLAGAEQHEGPIAVMPVEDLLAGFTRGLATFRRLFGRQPSVWARRRFGLTAAIPPILSLADIPYALHLALDDGLYPDDEASKLRWEGIAGSGVDAFSRIPLASETATSFLRFSERMAESMEEDIAAAVMFAHWPEESAPWLEDFRRISRYAPVFGKFVTLDSFFADSEPPGRVFSHPSSDYFAAYLSQAVATQSPDPIRRLACAISERHTMEAANWTAAIARLLGTPCDELQPLRQRLSQLDDRAIQGEPFTDPPEGDQHEQGAGPGLESLLDDAAEVLSGRLLAGAGDQPGMLVLNPLSFPRRTTIPWPSGWDTPPVAAPIRGAQIDAHHRALTLDLPASGFQWLAKPAEAATASEEPPTVVGEMLRNEFFEAHISAATGGIAFIKGYGRSPKRISQQLAFRFRRKRHTGRSDWGDEETYYSEMRCQSLEVTCDGPALGEIVTTGQIVDQTNEEPLARFRQVFRLWRGQRHLEVAVHLEADHLPEGDPWTNYYACRFAWNDPSAVLTRDLHGLAQPAPEGRFDAPHYIEIADDPLRTAIIPLDCPFHRRTGERMLDSLLVVAGETAQDFRFRICCDEPFPLRAALEARTAPVRLETAAGPPASGPRGWFLHIDSKNAQITSVRPVEEEGAELALAVRLVETEGRGRLVRLGCCRTPKSARIVNLAGETMAELSIDEAAVLVDLNRYEIATVILAF